MKKTARRQFTMSTLYSVAAIGLGLFLYEGRFWPLVIAIVAFGAGYLIVRREDNAD